MAKLIGTAGHVDHGKTSLIRALTGIDADRLPEEKKRGMTIDVGFAHLDLPGHGRVSIVDVPGHEKFIHNMLVGAMTIDIALLCVAADEGVKPQTREHFDILRLLPVDQMIVAMTRADLADDDTSALVAMEIEELLKGTRFAGSPILPVSSVTGAGLEELKLALGAGLDIPANAEDGPWYLPIDRAFAVKGHGVVVTGTLARGALSEGETAYLEPGHVEVRVRGIHSHDAYVQAADFGRRAALNLGGVKLEDVHRGMSVGAPGALFETRIFDARMEWLIKPKHGLRVRISVGAEEVMGKVFLSDTSPEIAQFRLESPVAVALKQPLIVRRYSPMDLLGGGRVVVPQATPRKKSEEALAVEESDDAAAILAAIGQGPNGVSTEEICRRLGKTPQSLGNDFERLQADGKIYGFAGLWLSSTGVERGTDQLLAALSQLHDANPMQAALPREKVVHEARLTWAGKPLDRILSHLVQQGKIAVNGTNIRAADFRVRLSEKQTAFLERVKAALDATGINVPGVADLARAIPAPVPAVEEILRLGQEAGEIVRIGEGLHYTTTQLDNIQAQMREAFAGRPFAASDFRDLTNSSRKYTIPLLEYFDARRVTLRQGDLRTLT